MTDTAAPLTYPDPLIRDVLSQVPTIAMVGYSANPNRPSYFVARYLREKGYRVIPVNPGLAGQIVDGEMVYGRLADIPEPFDMVDIFRNSKAAGPLTDEVIRLAAEKGIQVVWMQLGVRNDAAAARAEEAGLTVIMDRCPKIEYGRLGGKLSWGGVNSGIISARHRAAPGKTGHAGETDGRGGPRRPSSVDRPGDGRRPDRRSG